MMEPFFSTLKTIRLEASCQIVLAGLILQLSTATARSEPVETKALDGSALMQLALARDRAERRRHAGWVCDEEVVTVKTDVQGHLLDTQRETRAGVALDGTQGANGSLEAAGAPAAHPTREQEEAGRFDVTVDLARLADRFDLRREADGLSRDGGA